MNAADLRGSKTLFQSARSRPASGPIQEYGGVIVKKPSGWYRVVALPQDPSSSNCSFYPVGGRYPAQIDGDVTVAAWHTHPYNDTDRDRYSCAGRRFIATNRQNGGGSDAAWDLMADLTPWPLYTIDRYDIYRLDMNVQFRRLNPHVWQRSANGCALP